MSTTKVSLTIKARKGKKTITETLKNEDQKKRFAALLEKNGFRVITGGRI